MWHLVQRTSPVAAPDVALAHVTDTGPSHSSPGSTTLFPQMAAPPPVPRAFLFVEGASDEQAADCNARNATAAIPQVGLEPKGPSPKIVRVAVCHFIAKFLRT
jgi:hypothetical protein